MVRCDIGTAYYENWTVNCKKKKKKGTTECEKIQLEVILVLPNITMELSNLRIKNRVPLNVTKIKSDAMLVLLNVTMDPSNLRKKIKEPLYATEELSNLILKLHNVIMEPSNFRNK